MTNSSRNFALLIAVSLVLWWHPLSATLDLALSREEFTHILIILPISLTLIYLKRKESRLEGQGSFIAGSVVLLAALAILAFAKWGRAFEDDERLSVVMFGLVTWLIVSVVLCFGTRTSRLLIFPLLFLFWIVPLPEVLLGRIVESLQDQSAFASRILFRMVGTPATQDGIMLSIPGLDIEVARQCSSIRSSMVLIVMTMFLAQLFLHSWWRKALLIAAAIPLSVIKNGLRIVVIGELATRVDMGYLDGNLHHHGGIVFLAVALLIVVCLMWLLMRGENSKGRLKASM